MYTKRVLLATGLALTLFAVGHTALATDTFTLETRVVPFHWTIGGHTYSNADSYNNGEDDVPTSLNYDGTTYVPLRLLAEQLGQAVDWNDDTKTAVLTDAAGEDDPASDLPAPQTSIGYRVPASMTSAGTLRDGTADTAKALSTLSPGTPLQVLQETNGFLQVRTSSGSIGYVPLTSTDYVAEAMRPSWEQKADAIIALGLKFRGTPYQYGAKLGQTATFDCSSFMSFIYGSNGIKLPRDSRQQSAIGTEVSADSIRKGDLLFFTTPARKAKTGLDHIGHVAVYLGNGQLLHTYRVGIGVTITEFDANWKSRLVKAVRVLP